ncbi:MAG: TIGR04076 family protein [Clostridiales Family XIII bacterium]|jgi:uncharacterized repeat protein (TIGR04076 family)|nr:TIGR04076 family protein [Clostridiales Family XIII bacterium]
MSIEKKIKISVVTSKCHHYKPGDAIYLNGPMLDLEKSDAVCMSALNAIYPFVYAARKGVDAEGMGFDEMIFQCPDGPETVEFRIEASE